MDKMTFLRYSPVVDGRALMPRFFCECGTELRSIRAVEMQAAGHLQINFDGVEIRDVDNLPVHAPTIARDPLLPPVEAAQKGIAQILRWLEQVTGNEVEGIGIDMVNITQMRDSIQHVGLSVRIDVKEPRSKVWLA